MRRYRLRKSRDRATTRSRWRWSTAKQELTSSARLLNPWDLLKDDPNPHAPEGLVAGEMAFARNPVHVTNEGVGVLREVDGCSRQLPGAEHAGGIEWHDELTDHIAQRGEENLHRRARGDPVLVHASAVRGKGFELVVTGDVFGSGFERVRAGDRRNDGDGKKAGQLLHTALRGLASLCAVPTQKAKRRSTGQQQQGAAGEPSTHRASLSDGQSGSHAAFGVSPPPTCGSVCVRNGPTTLWTLAHAPISSALSPNRYRTTPSSTFTCSETSAITARRSALAPTCSRRPARVASSVCSNSSIAAVMSAINVSDIPRFTSSSLCAVAFSNIPRAMVTNA